MQFLASLLGLMIQYRVWICKAILTFIAMQGEYHLRKSKLSISVQTVQRES